MRFSATSLLATGLFTILSALPVFAQDGPGGHWKGTIDTPNGSMAIEVDLAKKPDWIGAISVPDRGMNGLPLEKVAIADKKVSFQIVAPNDPYFSGELASDGQTIAGNLTVGGNTIPLKLSRSGDATMDAPKANAASLDAQFLGAWEGALETPGGTLHLNVKFSNGDKGSSGEISVVEQGAKINSSALEATGPKLTMTVATIGGKFQGELNKEGTEMAGTWSQGPASLPLTLKKAK